VPSRGLIVLSMRTTHAAQAVRVFLRDPTQGFERARDVLSDRKERRRRPYHYDAVTDWHRPVHDLFGLPWPCSAETEFRELWSQVVREMSARGVVLGRASFGGWDDAGPALACASYCLARHLRPEHAVETGVARGITTRFILEALERNGPGGLWSIDLPPLLEPGLHEEIAVAVPEARRSRWTLVRGSSRQRLPALVTRLGSIGLFVHDSLHTGRNLRFELDQAWPALDPGGAVIVDDVDFNPALRSFVEQQTDARSIVAEHDDRRRLFAVLRKNGRS
jgi:methyltransferase family protein